MKLYDNIINDILALTEKCESIDGVVENPTWPMTDENIMILRSDMAYELGAQKYNGLGGTFVTCNSELIRENYIKIIGPDLRSITSDMDYARIAIVRVKEDTIGEGNDLFNAIRKLEYVRYHFTPDGFMMRVSSSQNKESVRVSKEAIKKGISFTDIGNRMIEAYMKNEDVECVGIYYITSPYFDYKAFERVTNKGEKITKAIDHILKDVKMDCDICSLQEVCDEVEGLRKLHFAKDTNS